MSLIEDLKAWYEEESYPPDGPEVDAELVDEKDNGNNGNARWGTIFTNVYKRPCPEGTRGMPEYVAVKDVRPATEYQDWGDCGNPEIYEVRPKVRKVVITEYFKVDK